MNESLPNENKLETILPDQGEHNGRPSLMTDELVLKIRKGVLAGQKYIDIQRDLEILPTTWDQWVYKDYEGFRQKLNDWKAERLLRKTEKLSEEILDMSHENDIGKVNTDVLRVKQKESEFVRETLGKNEGYSKRIEQTGAGGKDLKITFDSVFENETPSKPENNSPIASSI